jgi:fucose permease
VSRQIVRLGTRRVLVVYMAACAAGLSIVGAATVWPLVLIGLASLAMFDVFVDVAMNMQASWLSARRHRPVMNRLHGLWSLGTLLGGAVASSAAAAGVSLRVHLIGSAVVLVLMATFLSRWLLAADESVPDPEPAGAGWHLTRPGPPPLRSVELVLAGFFAVVIEAAAMNWAAFRLTEDLGASAGAGATAYVAVTVGMVLGRFFGDTAAHRVGSTRLLRTSTVVAATGLGVAGLVDVRAITLGGFALAGVGAATMIPKLYDDAAKMPGRSGAALGSLTAGIRTSSLVAPIAIGVLGSTSLSVGSAIALVSVPSAAAFLMVTRRL